MKIAKIDVIEAVVPFDDGSGLAGTPGRWSTLDQVLVRVETDTGLVGWGDCFAYGCRAAVAASARTMVAPLLAGRTLDATPEALMLEVQQRLHIFGRYGLTMFAISGFDIALWDIAAKAAGLPLAQLLGPGLREEATAYASMVRYGTPAQIEKFCRQALAQGYRHVKLHETDSEVIRAARRALGPDVHVSVDVNCAWSESTAQERIAVLREIDAAWVEEPVFPPEAIDVQQRLNAQFPIGAGENACTRHEFARMLEAGAVTYPQPSVIKVGGVTEFIEVVRLAQRHGVTAMAHSPYFGPGYFTTLQLQVVMPGPTLLEYFYADPAVDTARGGTPIPVGGKVAIPSRPGHGFDLDLEAIAPYRV